MPLVLEQDLLHIAIAQGEAVVEPDAMADDLPGEAGGFRECVGSAGGVMSGYLSGYVSGS